MLAGSAVEALELSADSPMRVTAEIDGTALVLLGAAQLAMPALESRYVHFVCPCDRATVAGYDRFAIDQHNKTADKISEALVPAMVGAAFAMAVLPELQLDADWERRGRAMLADAVVAGEAILATQVVTSALKIGLHHPHPQLYELPAGDPAYVDPGKYESMPSSHASQAMAAAAVTTAMFAVHFPKNRWKWAVGAGAGAAGLAAGAMRVMAGKHFPSDVAAGTLLGTAIGVAVPLLHVRW